MRTMSGVPGLDLCWTRPLLMTSRRRRNRHRPWTIFQLHLLLRGCDCSLIRYFTCLHDFNRKHTTRSSVLKQKWQATSTSRCNSTTGWSCPEKPSPTNEPFLPMQSKSLITNIKRLEPKQSHRRALSVFDKLLAQCEVEMRAMELYLWRVQHQLDWCWRRT